MRTSLIALAVTASLTVAASPAAQAAPAPARTAAPVTSLHTAATAAGGATAKGMFDVPGLDASVVQDYSRYITLQKDGHFKASIPAGLYFTDASRAWAATNSVTKANYLIDKQRMELMLHGDTAQQAQGHAAVASGVASEVLPMGEHATFQADWWGMTFTLDKVAADQLNDALAKTQDVSKLLDVLAAVGVVIAPEASAVIGAVLAGLAVAATALKECTTDDGVVIKALWVPVPWCEKPSGPFVPAPAKGDPAPTATA